MDNDVEMVETLINNRWKLLLPDYRAERPEWVAWEVERLDSMSLNIGPGDVVYDIGTEEGDITALIQSWIGRSDGGVCLFEPNALVWPNVKAIWEANKLKRPLYAFHGFAGDITTADLREFREPTFSWPGATSLPLRRDHGFSQLGTDGGKVIKLDDFALLVAPPSVITIDVEGAELFVLHGAEAVLATHHPLVYCSVHRDMMLSEYGQYAQELFDYMGNDVGYRSKVLGEDHELHVLFWHPAGREPRL